MRIPRLLEPLTETRVKGTEMFVAAETFELGRMIGDRRLSAVGLNFTDHFLGAIDRNIPPTSLRGWELLYTAGDAVLIDDLGGRDIAALASLYLVYRIMEMGDAGPGHTDWQSNFAYVPSPVGRLWAVHWSANYAKEWTVGAVYVPHPDLDWRSGSRVFTHDRSSYPASPL